jgi:hypothetical protein
MPRYWIRLLREIAAKRADDAERRTFEAIVDRLEDGSLRGDDATRALLEAKAFRDVDVDWALAALKPEISRVLSRKIYN